MENKLLEQLNRYLKNNLSQKRYEHSISVYETAIELAQIYNEDEYKIAVASLCHDMTKEEPNNTEKEIIKKYYPNHSDLLKVPQAWHGYTGVILAKEHFNIVDEQILNAIKYHTLGHKDMDNIAKIVFIADFIEPKRDSLHLMYYRNLVHNKNYSLDKILFLILKDNIDYLNARNFFVPKQSIDLLNNLKEKNKRI